jgi:hypothetical protein
VAGDWISIVPEGVGYAQPRSHTQFYNDVIRRANRMMSCKVSSVLNSGFLVRSLARRDEWLQIVCFAKALFLFIGLFVIFYLFRYACGGFLSLSPCFCCMYQITVRNLDRHALYVPMTLLVERCLLMATNM